MILLVDIGNTRIKWAFVENDVFSYGGASRYTEKTLMDLLSVVWPDLPSLEQVVIACVASKKVATLFHHWFKDSVPCYFLTSQKQFKNLHNAYKNPQQLGVDRWMSLVAGYQVHRKPFVIFNCGTAITVDAVSITGQHIGGLIIPGFELMQRSLIQSTANCKNGAVVKQKVSALLADNTHQAISGGSLYAVAAFIERLSEELKQALGKDLTYLISGGDASTVIPLLSEQFIHEPHLVLQGLLISTKIKKNENPLLDDQQLNNN